MKNSSSIAAIVVFLALFSICFLTLNSYAKNRKLSNLDEMNIFDQVDVRLFEAGFNYGKARLNYIVDRTTKNCFAVTGFDGMEKVDCQSLFVIPAIKEFWETGDIAKNKSKPKKKPKKRERD